MNFAQPQFLLALVLIPLAAGALWWANRKRQAALVNLGDRALIQRLSAGVNWRGRRWRQALWLLAVALVIIALARPQWGEDVRALEQQGIQVMVALDVSDSMLAEDVKPDRLTRARLEISDMMNRLKGDEVGLVLFSGASFIQFPLTSDYATARSFLDSAKPGVISRPGTVIGDAIRTAMTGFDPKREGQKVIVLFTDGEDHETDPLAAAKEAADQGIIIYTVGFGSAQGEPIPIRDAQGNLTGYKTDASGNTVLSKLDEATMQQIAQTTGGRYYNANQGDALAQLLDQLANLKAGTIQERYQTRGIERFQIFLAVALLLLVLAELIPDRRLVWRRSGSWLPRPHLIRRASS